MKNNLSYDVYYRRFAKPDSKPKGDEFEWAFLSAFKSVILSSDGTDIGYLKARNRVMEEMMQYNKLHYNSGWEYQFKIVKSINHFSAGEAQNVILIDNKVDQIDEDEKDWHEFFYWID